jgi:FkbM family methyltransferase
MSCTNFAWIRCTGAEDSRERLAVSSLIGTALRTWGYGTAARLREQQRSQLASHRSGRFALRGAQKLLSGGSVAVAGGAAAGLRLSTDHLPLDHSQLHGLLHGVLEPGVQEALRRHIAPGMSVYDIGADLGFFSLIAARLTGSTGRVESFEAVPASTAAVEANARLNGFEDRVAIHNVAVSDQPGRGSFLIPTEHSWAHLADRGRQPAHAYDSIDVPTIGLDDEIDAGRLPPPDVIKLDVEGSEIAVLHGLERTLRRRPVVVICELHETNAEILEILGRVGYDAENLDGTEPVAVAGAVHMLARRRST